jgi:hypothetical protein
VGSSWAAASYIAAYVSKGETEGLREAVREGLDRLPVGSSIAQQFQRIGTSLLGKREYSMQVRIELLSDV